MEKFKRYFVWRYSIRFYTKLVYFELLHSYGILCNCLTAIKLCNSTGIIWFPVNWLEFRYVDIHMHVCWRELEWAGNLCNENLCKRDNFNWRKFEESDTSTNETIFQQIRLNLLAYYWYLMPVTISITEFCRWRIYEIFLFYIYLLNINKLYICKINIFYSLNISQYLSLMQIFLKWIFLYFVLTYFLIFFFSLNN